MKSNVLKENKQLKEMMFKFEGESLLRTTELIEVLNGLNKIVPNEMRDRFFISEVGEGSIEIIARIVPVLDLFQNLDIDIMWETIEKISAVVGVCGGAAALKNHFGNKKINAKQLDLILKEINNDPNAMAFINQENFKNFKGITSVLKKRKKPLIISKSNDKICIDLETAEVIDLIANATDTDDMEDDVIRRFHIQMSRVSFVGKEQWKGKVLELNNALIFITIEDQNLLHAIQNNTIYFSGKEIIEADVLIESKGDKQKYTLLEYKKIVSPEIIAYDN